jgi:hypothetical protein
MNPILSEAHLRDESQFDECTTWCLSLSRMATAAA